MKFQTLKKVTVTLKIKSNKSGRDIKARIYCRGSIFEARVKIRMFMFQLNLIFLCSECCGANSFIKLNSYVYLVSIHSQ